MPAEPELIAVQPSTPTPPYGGTSDEAPWPYCKAQDIAMSDIPATRGDSPSGDSCSSHTEVGSDDHKSPVPSNIILPEQPVTAEPNADVAAIHDDEATITDTTPSRNPVRFRSGCGVHWFLHNRYHDRHHLDADPKKPQKIETIPAKNKFERRASTFGRGWVPYIHPEGQLYFRFKQYYTNSCLYDEDTLQDLEEAVDLLDAELQHHNDLPPSYDICLGIYVDDDNDKLACYYIADTINEEVLWLEDASMDLLVEAEDLPIFDLEHLKHAQRQSYWQHIYMFPHGRHYSLQQLKDLRDMLKFHLFDRVTSKTSCAPWSEEDLHRLSSITNEIHPDGDTLSAWDMFIVARLRLMTAAELLRHYSGTKWARLDSNRSARIDVTSGTLAPSWIFTVVSWMFFCQPMVYLKRLNEIWLDQNVNHRPWRKFINEIQQDWAGSITPSAVILTANVGFLAIQSVDIDSPHRSTGQIVSYASTLLSIGNIIACTILGQQHRPTSHLHADEALNYLVKRAKTHWQTQRLAVVLSVPIAFFNWALLSFSAAILWVGFFATSTQTRVSLFIITLLTFGFLGLVIMNGEWATPAVAQTLPAAMKRRLKKIPFRRLTGRKFSVPVRKWTVDKLRSHNSRTSSGAEDEPYSAGMQERFKLSRKPSPLRKWTDRFYGFQATSEPGEMSPV